MSTPDRLRRLGLSHLADKPEELSKALAAGIAQDRAREELYQIAHSKQSQPTPKQPQKPR